MRGTPSEMLDSYVRAFETSRSENVVPFYELPCTFIRPDGVWVVQDGATALLLASHLIDHPKAQGYQRTEVSNRVVRALAPGLAEITGDFVRYDGSQFEIARFGFTYIVSGDADRWRIVVVVAPGPVQTGYITPEMERQLLPAIPLRHLGTPEDIADAVVLLASEGTRWMTGQIIQVAGGHAL